MKKLSIILVSIALVFALQSIAAAQSKLPVQLVESGCKDGLARFMVANIGTARIDSIQAHFEGGVTATMRKPLPVGGINLTRQNCGCKGVLIGLVVYPGGLVIGRDEL